MRILISNDDGIQAEGINALRACLQEQNEIYIVAPDRERSATGHKITMHRPLRVKEWHYPEAKTVGWAVDGTPADCVKLGLEALLPAPPDLVISGINLGPNLGTDVLYSGTVSAAIEGIINGIPAIAVSLASYDYRDFSFSGKLIKELVSAFGNRLPDKTLLNINVPPGKPCGIKVTRLGNRRYINIFDKRTDPRGRVYYWMAGEPFDLDEDDPDTDVWAVKEGYVSITPVHFDLTDYKIMERLKKLLKTAKILNRELKD
ncbi:MAG: 5'/3'-nucleotidase SurE [Pelotomaculum sp.]|uniref:5'-nucleotidase SurE n=1 Tax=Pelotomaculum thermopropionicum (strain DSM 13744 / JCM 10971 / SI) TaxID=370438 RepID=SURE_PELTS|nr:RecName: Full=5'-nucleotidase SurE; AltName: Full=Nucleoside 5'-monophosphate phosphohydrolase [Pelotomaculum thermopropionicum SI]NPV73754.1 5'/3'-nucleotidase SurE [Pelotomaculum sp.]BAF59578.1 predicted acid phosphatase [Pelotomaculum thermopropionicum SI]